MIDERFNEDPRVVPVPANVEFLKRMCRDCHGTGGVVRGGGWFSSVVLGRSVKIARCGRCVGGWRYTWRPVEEK